VEIFLKKKIPIAAGLGGGSSDGASLLQGINSLFALRLKRGHLMTIGKRVGADVPFFLSEASTAIGRGIGERIEALSGLPSFWYLLTVMPFGLSTAEVYRGLQRHQKESQNHLRKGVGLTKVSCDVSMLCAFFRFRDFSWISRLIVNDLSQPAMVQKPALKRVLLFLRGEAPVSMMSGSGPTLFSLVRSREKGVALRRKVKARFGLDSVLCRGM
jgi:4-diphosphocytidyl-2-C-methyl-D-erythritol kinase